MILKDAKPVYGSRARKLIHEFLKKEKAHVSQKSRKNYETKLNLFFTWAGKKRIKKPDKESIRSYLDGLSFLEMSSSYINGQLTILKMFFTFCERSGEYPNVTEGLRRVRQTPGHKRHALSIEAFGRILNEMPTDSIIDKRNYAILLLLGQTGIRCQALVRIRLCDIKEKLQTGTYYINIKNKGYATKEHQAIISEYCLKSIRSYLDERDFLDEDSILFKSAKGGNLTESTVSSIFKKAARAVGIDDPKITCHSLRHMFATAAWEKGSTIKEIQAAMGHRSISTTSDVYTHFEKGRIDSSYRGVSQAIEEVLVKSRA